VIEKNLYSLEDNLFFYLQNFKKKIITKIQPVGTGLPKIPFVTQMDNGPLGVKVL